jgi:hypothetical protein
MPQAGKQDVGMWCGVDWWTLSEGPVVGLAGG